LLIILENLAIGEIELAPNASHKRRPDKGVRWRAFGPEQT